MKTQETEDAELIALALLAFHDAVTMLVTNQDREQRGVPMAYGERCLINEAAWALAATLKLRGVLPR